MRRLLVVAIALALLLSPSSVAAGQATPDADTIEYGVVAGNAFAFLEDEIEDAPSGEVSVVALGPADFSEGYIAAVVYNGTDSDMSVDVAFRIRDSEGTLVATISGETSRPGIIEAGGLGLVVTYSPDEAAGLSDLELEPRVNADEPSDYIASTYVAPEIVEVAPTREGYVGIAENTTSQEMGLILFNIVCFDEEGNVTGGGFTSADTDPIEPGDDTSFSFDSWDIGDIPCDYFLVAGSGWS